MMKYRHLLKADFNSDWTEVTKEDWIKAERQAGFRPNLWSGDPAYMTTYATGGFFGAGISGKLEISGDGNG